MKSQAMLVVCDDAANLQKIAAGIRGMVGVKEVRSGTFQHERVLEHKVAMFYPAPVKGNPSPGVEIES
jgi:hypothetical protein